MEQYIPKSALVAEIEKQMEYAKFGAQQAKENNDYVSWVAWSEHFATCGDIFKIIDNIEVKEVDLEKELSYEDYMDSFKKYPDLSDDWGFDECWMFAKHFFELGIKAHLDGGSMCEGEFHVKNKEK